MKGLEDYPRPSAMPERDLFRGYGLIAVPRSGERPVSEAQLDAADLQDAPSTEEPWAEPDWPDLDIEYDRWRDQQLTDLPMG